MSASIPSNTVYANGVGAVTDANFNSIVQNAGLVSNLRNFVGINGMAVQLLGSAAFGDGTNGQFYFDSSSTANDDGQNVIAPNGLLTGRWLRLFNPFTFDVYNVRGFGAIGDDNHDDTASVQAAIAACETGGGGVVYFPPGRYKITGTLSSTKSGVSLQGADWAASTINFQNGSADCITSKGANFLTGQIEGFSMKDLNLDHTGKTGGRTLYCEYSDRIILENIKVIDPWTMFELYANNTVIIKNIWNEALNGGPGAFGLFLHAAADGSNRTDYVVLEDFVVNAQYGGADGIVIDGLVATVIMTRGNILQCRYGIQVNNTAAAANNIPNYLNFTDVNMEGALNACVQFNSGNNIKMRGCNIINNSGATGQGSADTNGLQINWDPVGLNRDYDLSGCTIGGSNQSAIILNARNINLRGCKLPSWTSTPPNTYPGIVVGANASDVTIIGNSTEIFGTSNCWSYGLHVMTGSVAVLEDGNNFRLSQTKESLWENTDSQSVAGADVTGNEFGILGSPAGSPQGVSVSGNFTLTAQQVLNGVLGMVGTGGFIATMPTAAQLVTGLPSPAFDKLVDLLIVNGTTGTMTIANNSGVTMTGNTSGATTFAIGAGVSRVFKLSFKQTTLGSEAVTLWG